MYVVGNYYTHLYELKEHEVVGASGKIYIPVREITNNLLGIPTM